MPRYLFRCETCQAEETVERPMRRATDPMPCLTCNAPMGRIFTAPQLNTDPFHLQDENKFAFGKSETERVENYKKWDAVHAKNFNY